MTIPLISSIQQPIQLIGKEFVLTSKQETIFLIATVALGLLIGTICFIIPFFFKERAVRHIKPDGTIYEGSAKGFYVHGHGKIIFPDGGSMEVEHKNGKLADGPVKIINTGNKPYQVQGHIRGGVLEGNLTNGDIYKIDHKDSKYSFTKQAIEI